jgi:transcriptional regulator with XRE-family HTH domain
MNPYKTITGRTIDLSAFSPAAKRAFEALTEAYDRRPDWQKFSDAWQKMLRPVLTKLRPPKKKTQHPLYRIAQDLELRLGIAQGVVAEPDYRDYLLDQIEEQFGSRYRFCKKAGIPEAFLSQVLSGKKDFSVDTLRRAAQTLSLGLALLPKADFVQPACNTFLALRHVIPLVVSDLSRVTAIHDTLRRYRNSTRRLNAFAKERSILDDPLMDELAHALDAAPPEQRADQILRLLEEKRDELETFLNFLREKVASLADQPPILSKGEQARGSPAVLRV